MQQVPKVVAGACVLVGVATTFGLASNALRSDGLPLIRKPLGETRVVVGRDQLMASAPIRVPRPKSTVAKADKASASQPDTVIVPKAKAPQSQTEPQKTVAAVATIPLPPQQPAKKVVIPKPEAKKSNPAAKKIQALFTNLKDAKACFDNKSAIFLDARAIEDYEAEHIARALWLCFESVEEDYDKVLGKTPKDQLLITYCSDQQCASAIKLADELVARGHTRVVIMLEGLPGWKDASYPVASGKETGD